MIQLPVGSGQYERGPKYIYKKKKKKERNNYDLQGREVHGEGQAHGKERKEPCRQRDGAEGNDPVKYARDDLKKEGKQPANPPGHA